MMTDKKFLIDNWMGQCLLAVMATHLGEISG